MVNFIYKKQTEKQLHGRKLVSSNQDKNSIISGYINSNSNFIVFLNLFSDPPSFANTLKSIENSDYDVANQNDYITVY